MFGDIRELDPSRFPKCRIMVLDPPWKYNDRKKIRKDGKTPTRRAA